MDDVMLGVTVAGGVCVAVPVIVLDAVCVPVIVDVLVFDGVALAVRVPVAVVDGAGYAYAIEKLPLMPAPNVATTFSSGDVIFSRRIVDADVELSAHKAPFETVPMMAIQLNEAIESGQPYPTAAVVTMAPPQSVNESAPPGTKGATEALPPVAVRLIEITASGPAGIAVVPPPLPAHKPEKSVGADDARSTTAPEELTGPLSTATGGTWAEHG